MTFIDYIYYIKEFEPLIGLLTLIFLGVYVYKTWHIATSTRESVNEMRAQRQQQSTPFVVVFFDFNYSKNFIEIVIKNMGLGLAEMVRVKFNPQLESSLIKNMNEAIWLTDGIGTLPPGSEFRTIFDSTIGRFEKDLALTYTANISYRDNYNDLNLSQTIVLDLSPYKNVIYSKENNIGDLCKIGDTLKGELTNISKSIDNLGKK